MLRGFEHRRKIFGCFYLYGINGRALPCAYDNGPNTHDPPRAARGGPRPCSQRRLSKRLRPHLHPGKEPLTDPLLKAGEDVGGLGVRDGLQGLAEGLSGEEGGQHPVGGGGQGLAP